MSIENLQRLYTKVSSDKRFRARLIADPSRVLSEFDLTEEEKEAVRWVQSRLSITGRGKPTRVITPLAPWIPELEVRTQ